MTKICVAFIIEIGEFDGTMFHIHKALKERKDFKSLEPAIEYFENLKKAMQAAGQ